MYIFLLGNKYFEGKHVHNQKSTDNETKRLKIAIIILVLYIMVEVVRSILIFSWWVLI